jgi:hypothetical protein
VLGPLAENNLFLATDNYGAAWLMFPSVLFLGAIILAGMLYPAFQKWRTKENTQKPRLPEQQAAISSDKPPVTSICAPIFTFVIVAFFAWTLWEAREWWFRARLFPWTIGFAGLALALLQFNYEIASLMRSRRAGIEDQANGHSALARRRTLGITAWILGSFAAIWLLGFPVAVPLTILLYLKVGAREHWPISIALAFFGWVSFYGLFDYVLHVPFPEGQSFIWMSKILGDVFMR